ncbi:MAG TPA: dCTP deaminase [Terriglobales bacterium]|nr:dCTP deaminase [Terriglobales bacterium]
MLLSDIDIAKRLVHPDPQLRLIVTPIISAAEQFGPSSLDVRLSTDFQRLENINTPYLKIDTPHSEEQNATGAQKAYAERVILSAGGHFYLHPGEFVLASTLEWFRLPDDLAGRIEGRSSWGRRGLLVHATAGFVDPGFAGVLTFELSNAGRLPIELRPGLRIGQVCFFQMLSRSLIPYPKKRSAKYFEATTLEASKAEFDPEVADRGQSTP